jgi:hypothetical protein
MSFTLAGGGADRAFELVRLSLLQDGGLPFADALTVEQMQQAFTAEGVLFGEADGDANARPEDDDGIVYTPAVTLWAMLSQALFTDRQRACVAAGEGKGGKRCQEPLFDSQGFWLVDFGHHGTSQTCRRRRNGVSRSQSCECSGDDL